MRLQAFISSNLDEFGPPGDPNSTRRKIAAVLREYATEPIMWEDFSKPAGIPVEKLYMQYLQDCQLYIGIIPFVSLSGN